MKNQNKNNLDNILVNLVSSIFKVVKPIVLALPSLAFISYKIISFIPKFAVRCIMKENVKHIAKATTATAYNFISFPFSSILIVTDKLIGSVEKSNKIIDKSMNAGFLSRWIGKIVKPILYLATGTLGVSHGVSITVKDFADFEAYILKNLFTKTIWKSSDKAQVSGNKNNDKTIDNDINWLGFNNSYRSKICDTRFYNRSPR